MCRRIGEYSSLELSYFVNLTSSCSLIPFDLHVHVHVQRYFDKAVVTWQELTSVNQVMLFSLQLLYFEPGTDSTITLL